MSPPPHAAAAAVRKAGTLPYLRPDGKAQVTVEYDENNQPVRIDTVVLSTQHSEGVSHEQIERDMIEHVIRPAISAHMLDENTKYYINPTGRFVVGGPQGDSGLTGRKIIVDTYGGMGRHGGGAFSGKDPTKVDRSAAYALRHAAKNVVAAGLAKRCEIGAAYAIGVAHPVSITVDTFGTGAMPDAAIADLVARTFDMRPTAIIERLDLRRPIYRQVASYGHFGRDDLDLSWERLGLRECPNEVKRECRRFEGIIEEIRFRKRRTDGRLLCCGMAKADCRGGCDAIFGRRGACRAFGRVG